MRISKKAHEASLSKTHLEIAIHQYFNERDLDPMEDVRAVSFELRNYLLDMGPNPVERAETHSALKDLIKEHQENTGLTDIEVCQALTAWIQGHLKFDLRYERNGNYDEPADVDNG